jgi:hypothetical protein
MSEMLLVKHSRDYADEFDTYGFVIIKKDFWDKYVNALTDEYIDGNPELYFGTNEMHSFCDKEDYLRDFEITPITNDEVQTVLHLFKTRKGKGSFIFNFGFFPIYEDLIPRK